MKKVLIVNKSFETGGIQSSMVNMANELAHHCQVDLFVYNPEGPIRERLSEKVRVLPVGWRFRAIGMTMKQAIQAKDLRILGYRVFISLWTKLFSNRRPIQDAIRHEKILTGYDLAIAFHQEQRKHSVVSGFTRVVDQLTDAKVKIAWTHFDSGVLDLDSAYNEPFYQKMDRIFCVSRSLMERFQRANPTLASKVDFCYNFLEYDKIRTQGEQPQKQAYPQNMLICFSACRLVKEKALVRAIHALAPVFKAHSDVCWYIAGNGVEESNISQAIGEEDLAGRIVLLGNQSNPYPYMKHADLVMNVSYHEAAPMVFFEAKALGKPVFATRTASALELLKDGTEDFLCENTEEGLFTCFSELMNHRERIAQAEKNLRHHPMNNQESLGKIMSLF